MSDQGRTVRPYGDTQDDGAVQLAFTLPLDPSARSTEAARALVRRMGFSTVEVTHARSPGAGFTFFVVTGRGLAFGVEPDGLTVPELELKPYSFDEANREIAARFGRKLVIVGACTGADAHTVGIDAIINMKGYKGHYGLERYPMVDARNLGSQVDNELLLRRAIEMSADAVLVSQVVTQKESHVKTLTEFVELAEGFGVRGRMVLVCGGPRITNRLAQEIGFDAGFGRGCYAEHVLTFVIRKLVERREAGGG